jgi:outer membrane protein
VHLAYGPVFFGFGGLGLNLYRDSRWRFGANLAFGGGRKESADDRLRGLGDVDRSVLGGLFAVYRGERMLTRARIATDIGGKGQGTVARLDVFGRLRGGEGLAFFAGPGLTWADRRHTRTFFGVTGEQAARSGLPVFDAGAGVSSLRLSAGAAYRADARWRLVGIYSLTRLQGDAAGSPIIESRTQNSFFVAAIYLLR